MISRIQILHLLSRIEILIENNKIQTGSKIPIEKRFDLAQLKLTTKFVQEFNIKPFQIGSGCSASPDLFFARDTVFESKYTSKFNYVVIEKKIIKLHHMIFARFSFALFTTNVTRISLDSFRGDYKK